MPLNIIVFDMLNMLSIVWQLNYRAEYEKTKTQYTLPQDVPQLVKAKANAELYSEVREPTNIHLHNIPKDVIFIRNISHMLR